MAKQMKGILGTKLGMTQVFDDTGQVTPALAKCPASGLFTLRGSMAPKASWTAS